jgi:hypothetical protein
MGAELALDIDDDGRHALVKADDVGVLEVVDDVGDVLEQDRRAIAVGDDNVAIGAATVIWSLAAMV